MNKEFEDIAWSQMQKMLDQEMPVVEKKRRRGLFWLFLLSGIVALSGTLFYWGNKKENAEKNQIIQSANKKLIVENKELNTSINSVNNKGLNSENNKLNLELDNKNNQIKQQIITQSSDINGDNSQLNGNNKTEKRATTREKTTTIGATAATRATVQVAPTQENTPALAQNAALPSLHVGATFTVALSTDIKGVSDAPQTTDVPIIATTIPTQTPPQYLNENKDNIKFDTAEQGEALTQEVVLPLTINKLSAIKSKSTSEIVIEKSNPVIIKTSPIIRLPNPKTHFSLILGVHTEGVKNIDGGQFGVMTHTYLGKQWSFFAGINYRKTTVQVDSATDALIGYQAVGTTTTNALPKSLDLIPVKKIILNQLNYLELPIGFNYAFNKKMSVAMGIKAAYLLSTNVRISADSSVFFLKEMSQKSSYTMDQSTNYSVTQLGLQRWDFAAIGGINYSFTKRLQLGLRYDLGLNSVVNRANWTAYNRFLGLNAVYLLK